MAITLSTAVRNARLDAIEATVGTSAKLLIRTGTPPTNVGAASTGTVLATLALPSDWMATASSGAAAKTGTWEDATADATGTAGHFEITATNGTTVGIRGTVGQGSGDLSLDNTSIVAGQDVVVTAFTITDGNAGS